MELREWLIILGLALVSLIVVDGVRRLQRQRRVPRLDQAVKDLPAAKFEDLDDAAKEAEINWELPNGGARVIKPADYSNLGHKPKLERQEHPGPSKVLSDFRSSFSNSVNKTRAGAHFAWSRKHEQPSMAGHASDTHAEPSLGMSSGAETERREPSIFADSGRPAAANASSEPSANSTSANSTSAHSTSNAHPEPAQKKSEPTVTAKATAPTPEPKQHEQTEPPALKRSAEKIGADEVGADTNVEKAESIEVKADKVKVDQAVADVDVTEAPAANNVEAGEEKVPPIAASDETVVPASSAAVSDATAGAETSAKDEWSTATPNAESAQAQEEVAPVLRAEPEDAVAAKHASDTPKRRHLRSDTAGEDRELDDDEIDEYRLIDFEGIGRSFKRRLIERRKEKVRKKAEKERKKAEKAKRAEALAKQKAERKALEAERKALEAQQRREAKEAADAEKARVAQELAAAREAAAAAEREAAQYNEPAISAHDNVEHDVDQYDDYASDDGYRANVVRTHPTLEKALRHDVNSERARDTLTDASEMVVISVLSREPEGFDGGKLLELMMVCGLRYSREMGVFHRFETESADSELQFSMVNVLKPGTFPIEEMDEFVTPGITLLMPLPGAVDSSAAFEAMVETAMVVVRHMGGELKDENRSVMTAQTIEFARQRVHEFERRHRLHRHMQAR